MRLTVFALMFCLALTHLPTAAVAADPSTFDVMGLKPGMTFDEVQTAAENNGLTISGRDPGPSFEQAVAQRRGQQMNGAVPSEVSKIDLVGDDARIEVFFVPTPEGPRAYQIAASVLKVNGGADLRASIIVKYGQPDQSRRSEWLWGDTAIFYARTKPYLEYQPTPVSATSPKPIGRLILADPALQKDAQEAIADEATKGS